MTTPPDSALPACAHLVARMEGTVLHPYQDSGGVWTIGIGSLVMPDGSRVTRMSRIISQDEAEALMAKALVPTLAAVRAMCKVALTVNQAAALTSFAYNEGLTGLRTSTLMRLLNAGQPALAAAQFGAWVYVKGEVIKGLVNRRNIERSVFLGLSNP